MFCCVIVWAELIIFALFQFWSSNQCSTVSIFSDFRTGSDLRIPARVSDLRFRLRISDPAAVPEEEFCEPDQFDDPDPDFDPELPEDTLSFDFGYVSDGP